jgi:hypothetical protein
MSGPRGKRITGRIAVLLVAVSIATGVGAVALPGSAQAATPAYGTADVCFQAPMPWIGGYGAYGNYPVYLEAWSNGVWHQVATQNTQANGCLRALLPAGYNWRFRVAYRDPRVSYTGQSGYRWITAGSYNHFGTVYLQYSR